MEKALILLSGGLDSAVNLKLALGKFSIVRVLTFDYGQKARRKEIEACRSICRRYRLKNMVVSLPWLKGISTSALTKRTIEIPKMAPEKLDDRTASRESAQAVWVPNRNGAFINIAASFAEGLDASKIITGFNYEEGRTFPDNSERFIKAVNGALKISCLKRVSAISFTSRMTKDRIVAMGMKIDAPLDLIWSCYKGGKKLCLECESCLRSKRAFEKVSFWEWFKANNRYMR